MPDLSREQHVELNYRIDGSGELTWLLFNGATRPLEFWDPVAAALKETDTVVRFDQRRQNPAEGTFSLPDTLNSNRWWCSNTHGVGVQLRFSLPIIPTGFLQWSPAVQAAKVPEEVLTQMREAGRSGDRRSQYWGELAGN